MVAVGNKKEIEAIPTFTRLCGGVKPRGAAMGSLVAMLTSTVMAVRDRPELAD